MYITTSGYVCSHIRRNSYINSRSDVKLKVWTWGKNDCELRVHNENALLWIYLMRIESLIAWYAGSEYSLYNNIGANQTSDKYNNLLKHRMQSPAIQFRKWLPSLCLPENCNVLGDTKFFFRMIIASFDCLFTRYWS